MFIRPCTTIWKGRVIANKNKSKCISCAASFGQVDQFNDFATIHITCFKDLRERLSMADKRIKEVELVNIKNENVPSYQSVEIQTDFLEKQINTSSSTPLKKLTDRDVNKMKTDVVSPNKLSATKLNQPKSQLIMETSKVKNTKLSENKILFRDRKSKFKKGMKKSYECYVCMFAFDRPNKLESHISTIHMGKKDFMCKKCNKSYAHSETLRSHNLRVHLKLRPYQCNECDNNYTRKTELNNHIREKHSKSQA